MEIQEEILLLGIVNKDRKSFESLYKEYYDSLFSFAESYVCCPGLAEDIIQEVFIKLWENPIGNITKSLRAYLFFMVKNRCVDYLRSVKVEDKKRMKLMEAQLISDSVDIELDEQAIYLIKTAIEELPDQCRQVYKLSVFEGLRNHEIAEELGISESSVKVQIFRAKKYLQVELFHLRSYLISLIILFFLLFC